MREDDCRSLLCLQQNFAKMLRPRVQAVVTASCFKKDLFQEPNFRCVSVFPTKTREQKRCNNFTSPYVLFAIASPFSAAVPAESKI